MLLVLEVVFAAAIAAGVAVMLGVGAGLVAAGALGVLACEWLTARRAAQ